jgi:hypothetical protein
MKRLAKIQRALKAPKNQKGYGYNYRKASDILQLVKPLLAEENLTILLNDRIEFVGDKYFLSATAGIYAGDGSLITETVAFAELDITHRNMSAEQATGSASSYARKYALCGLLAIDDSNNDPDAIVGEDLAQAKLEMEAAQTREEANLVWTKYKRFRLNEEFSKVVDEKRLELGAKDKEAEQKNAEQTNTPE